MFRKIELRTCRSLLELCAQLLDLHAVSPRVICHTHPQLRFMRIPEGAVRNSNFEWRGQLAMTVPPGGIVRKV
jgi:hypothetical protein